MTGQDIRITGEDGTYTGYMALPPGGTGPGLVVLQEIFGVNKVMRDICDRFAAEGFVTLCPDLFWRLEPGIQLTDKTEPEMQRAFDLMGRFDPDLGVVDIAHAITHLRKHPATTGKVGVIGYCLGGQLAYLAACHTDTDASVGYYGVGIADRLDQATHIKRPLLLHVAGQDQFVDGEAQQAMHEGLEPNPMVTLHDYPEDEHAFARPGGEHYNPVAADNADRRTLDFLHLHLG
ncbi:dienelactone hydrolase family protein [Maricaulis sp. CAU 1757]